MILLWGPSAVDVKLPCLNTSLAAVDKMPLDILKQTGIREVPAVPQSGVGLFVYSVTWTKLPSCYKALQIA